MDNKTENNESKEENVPQVQALRLLRASAFPRRKNKLKKRKQR